ncbi:MAG: DNA repair protein RecO [Ottowia sp.]|nr:DNA repair protein RecO [Ottowia sp.]
MKRISHEPGYVLHHYDWSESSVIIEAFTRTHGRVALVARGAKRPSSNFRPVLLPLQPLFLSWGGQGEVRTLKGAEWGGGHVMPGGETLMAGCYANELVLRLVAREDPHEALFDAYADLVRTLAAGAADRRQLAVALRAFELVLLHQCGYLPTLDIQTFTQQPLQPEQPYRIDPESGLAAVSDEPLPGELRGADWAALAQAFMGLPVLPGLMTVIDGLDRGRQMRLRRQLRRLLQYHSGIDMLRTRQLAHDLSRLSVVP